MAKELIIRVRDDLDGHIAEDAETISFAYRGVAYEIDLAAANVELFDKTIGQFIDAGRKAPKPPPKTRGSGKYNKGSGGLPLSKVPVEERAGLAQRRRIRAWAIENGIEVYARGILPINVIEAYRAEHPEEQIIAHGSYRDMDGDEGGDDVLQASRNRKGESASKEQRSMIRQWAIENGYDQAPTGMVKREVIEAYEAAHAGQSSEQLELSDEEVASRLQAVADDAYAKANPKRRRRGGK